ncbi:hypothetical protein J2S00_003048 [Caldalkalibacillus uzonensis]|uniref:MetS family NSS transporter small subunit n=1 Tax=Caldalkalibacillus uzonensis TaxID=353224 RepID=A0ABU0CUZ5_9BACI|nr:hypothetical protein [Caldalkalibacillus uzonensis]
MPWLDFVLAIVLWTSGLGFLCLIFKEKDPHEADQ